MPTVLSAAAVFLIGIAGAGQAQADGGGELAPTAPAPEIPQTDEPIDSAPAPEPTATPTTSGPAESIPEETTAEPEPEASETESDPEPQVDQTENDTPELPIPVLDHLPTANEPAQNNNHQEEPSGPSAERTPETEVPASDTPEPVTEPTEYPESTASGSDPDDDSLVPVLDSLPGLEEESDTTESDELADTEVANEINEPEVTETGEDNAESDVSEEIDIVSEPDDSNIIPVSEPWSEENDEQVELPNPSPETVEEPQQPDTAENEEGSESLIPVIVAIPVIQDDNNSRPEVSDEPVAVSNEDADGISPVIDTIPGRNETSEEPENDPHNNDRGSIIPASIPLPSLDEAPAPAPAESAAAPPPESQPEAAPAPAYVLPIHGRITSGFGARWGTFHYGLDIAAPIGTEMYAMADGVVIEEEAATGFGWWIRIRHDDGDVTVYGHMFPQDSRVHVGDRVSAGDVISLVGNNGQTTGPHGHVEVWKGGLRETRVDPLQYMRDHGVAI